MGCEVVSPAIAAPSLQRELEALRASEEFAHLQWLEARNPRAAAEILRSLRNAG
jgi:hypothetical protein